RAVAAGGFIGEEQLEELGVTEAVGLGQREPFGEGVEQPAELHPPQQGTQLRRDGDVGGGQRAPPSVPVAAAVLVANSAGSRANRPATTVPAAGDVGTSLFSVARSSMRPINPTFTASASSARAHAASTRAG